MTILDSPSIDEVLDHLELSKFMLESFIAGLYQESINQIRISGKQFNRKEFIELEESLEALINKIRFPVEEDSEFFKIKENVVNFKIVK